MQFDTVPFLSHIITQVYMTYSALTESLKTLSRKEQKSIELCSMIYRACRHQQSSV